MTDTDLETAVQQILDRQAITDILHRYCRGCDRCDEAELRRVFWPEATMEYPSAEALTVEDFLAWGLPLIKNMRTAHRLSNILIDLDDDGRARSESYSWAYHSAQLPDGSREDAIPGCRYLDHFEKRDGEWRIIRRTVVVDYVLRQPSASDFGFLGNMAITGRKDRQDPLYSHALLS